LIRVGGLWLHLHFHFDLVVAVSAAVFSTDEHSSSGLENSWRPVEDFFPRIGCIGPVL
jgi:hypothetical protein